MLPDGLYRGVFTVRYVGGEEPETASRVVMLDTVAPVAAVNVDYPLFSPDGKYTYQLTGTDEAGNSVTEVLRGITVDTRPARVQVSTARRSFSPNNDGFFDTIAFNLSATPPDGIMSWSPATVYPVSFF